MCYDSREEDEEEELLLEEDVSEDGDLSDDEIDPANLCRTGIRVRQMCYDSRCGRTGQTPGGRNCAALPTGANGCCMTRITRPCTGPNMDRCRVPPARGNMGNMGNMGGNMGRNMGNGNGGGPDDEGPGDEAEAVGDPHLTTASGSKVDLCCEGGDCRACPEALLQEEEEDELLLQEEDVSKDGDLFDDEIDPANLCRTGIRVRQMCFDSRCGRTGQRPGGRNCASLPTGANGCCMSRIQRRC